MNRGVSVDFNALLKAANRVVAALLLVACSKLAGNQYVNETSVILALLLCLQTEVALTLERRQRDAFVLLLSFYLIAYFSFRIFTLEVFPVSVVFIRFSYDVRDTNFALIFILIANLFLYAGLFVVPLDRTKRVMAGNRKPLLSANVIWLLLCTVILGYGRSAFGKMPELARWLNYVASLITPETVALMALGYYALFKDALSRSFAAMMFSVILLNVVIHTLVGSRSPIVYLIQSLMVVWFAVFGCIRIEKKYLALGGLALPILVAMLLGSFAIGTIDRATLKDQGAIDAGVIESAETAALQTISNGNLTPVLSAAAGRAGFFDYSAEIIAHRTDYKSLFNWTNYAESVLHILTPELHAFDQPLLSNQMEFVYNRWGRPSEYKLLDSYQSDQFGVYGEFYALFGWACLPLLFAGSFAFKRLYVDLTTVKSPLLSVMRRIIVLSLFCQWINSFGLDWLVESALSYTLTYLICAKVFSCERVSTVDQE